MRHPALRQLGFALAALTLALIGGIAPAQPVPVGHARTAAPSGVWYEIFVRSWYDTDGDGIGDLNGVTAKLDYLQSLGVSGIWLMPINPSPSYHGYDVTDYRAVNPPYGTLADFRRLTEEAHQRGIKVIIDMVINHTSDESPWFKAALDPHSRYRDWYSWAGKYTDLASGSAAGSRAWQAAGKQHYLGIFAPGMPDLNYDNPAVRAEMIAAGRFWLQQGADGFRLDAARHIYENFPWDADDPATLAKNLDWWNAYRRGLDTANPRAWLVGEVTQPAASQLAPYLKPLDAVFNFPLAAQLIDAAKSERNQGLAPTLERSYASYRDACRCDTIRDAPFLSNHDQERVMSQLDGNARHMRMAAAMLLTLPGEPFLYYGEELGMLGRKPDPALRGPMRWQASPATRGETRWKAVDAANLPLSVAAQQADSHSLLNRYRELVHWRIEIPALRAGGFAAYPHASDHLAAWQRPLPGGGVLVVHNLSGQTQTMALDVPDEPRYTRVLEATGTGATIHDNTLSVPAYTSVVLQ